MLPISSLETWRYPYWGAYSFERKLNAELLWHRWGVNTFLNNLETLSYGTVMEVRLPCYLVLFSVDSKARSKDSHIPMAQPINIYEKKVLWLWYHFVCVNVMYSLELQCLFPWHWGNRMVFRKSSEVIRKTIMNISDGSDGPYNSGTNNKTSATIIHGGKIPYTNRTLTQQYANRVPVVLLYCLLRINT